MKFLVWLRVLFNVLRGKEDPLDRRKEQERKVEVARDVMKGGPPVRRDLTTRPIRLYGKTKRGKKVHIRRVLSPSGSYLCGAKPGRDLYNSIPPLRASDLCSTCLVLAEKEEK